MIVEYTVPLPMHQCVAEGAPELALVTQTRFQSCMCIRNLMWRLRMTSLDVEYTCKDEHQTFRRGYDVASDARSAACT
jgi:hypothetical protein